MVVEQECTVLCEVPHVNPTWRRAYAPIIPFDLAMSRPHPTTTTKEEERTYLVPACDYPIPLLYDGFILNS